MYPISSNSPNHVINDQNVVSSGNSSISEPSMNLEDRNLLISTIKEKVFIKISNELTELETSKRSYQENIQQKLKENKEQLEQKKDSFSKRIDEEFTKYKALTGDIRQALNNLKDGTLKIDEELKEVELHHTKIENDIKNEENTFLDQADKKIAASKNDKDLVESTLKCLDGNLVCPKEGVSSVIQKIGLVAQTNGITYFQNLTEYTNWNKDKISQKQSLTVALKIKNLDIDLVRVKTEILNADTTTDTTPFIQALEKISCTQNELKMFGHAVTSSIKGKTIAQLEEERNKIEIELNSLNQNYEAENRNRNASLESILKERDLLIKVKILLGRLSVEEPHPSKSPTTAPESLSPQRQGKKRTIEQISLGPVEDPVIEPPLIEAEIFSNTIEEERSCSTSSSSTKEALPQVSNNEDEISDEEGEQTWQLNALTTLFVNPALKTVLVDLEKDCPSNRNYELHKLCLKENLTSEELVKGIQANRSDLNTLIGGWAPIHLLIKRGDPALLSNLILGFSQYLDLTIKTSEGWNCLQLIAAQAKFNKPEFSSNFFTILPVFYKKDLLVTAPQGCSPLHIAAFFGHDKIFASFGEKLKSKPNLFDILDEQGCAPIHYAASSAVGKPIIDYLVSKKANINLMTFGNFSPLYMAIRSLCLENVKTLTSAPGFQFSISISGGRERNKEYEFAKKTLTKNHQATAQAILDHLRPQCTKKSSAKHQKTNP